MHALRWELREGCTCSGLLKCRYAFSRRAFVDSGAAADACRKAADGAVEAQCDSLESWQQTFRRSIEGDKVPRGCSHRLPPCNAQFISCPGSVFAVTEASVWQHSSQPHTNDYSCLSALLH